MDKLQVTFIRPHAVAVVPLIAYPISVHNWQNLYSFLDQNDSKLIPFGTAHTYVAYIRENPLPWGVGLAL